MADPTNPGQPSDDATSRGNPINVNEATIQGVTVTRMDVNKGHIKELQTDLLEELCRCIEEQTATLRDVIQATKDELANALGSSDRDRLRAERESREAERDSKTTDDRMIALQQQTVDKQEAVRKLMESLIGQIGSIGGGGGGGDGDGGGGGAGGEGPGGLAQARATQKEFDFLRDNVKSGRLEIQKWHKIFTAGALNQFKENMDAINQGIFRFGKDMFDLSGSLQKVNKLYELSQTGLIEVTALYEDLGSTLVQGRFSMQETVDIMNRMGDRGATLIGTFGADLKDVSTALYDAEQNLRGAFGDEVFGRARREETAAVLAELVSQQRRAGVIASNQQIIQSRDTQRQLRTLDLIAMHTGQTRDAVLALQDEERKTLAELEASNVINSEQRKALERRFGVLRAQGLGPVVDELMKAIQEGGVDQGLQMMMADPAYAKFLQQVDETGTSNFERIQGALTKLADNTADDAAAIDGMTNAFGKAMTVLGEEGVGAARMRLAFPGIERLNAAVLEAQRRTAAVESGEGATTQDMLDSMDENNEGLGATVTGAINDVLDGLKSNFGEGGALILALAANTFALGLNTAALVGKGALGLLERFRGRGARAGRPATSSPKAQAEARRRVKGGMFERATVETDKQAAKRVGKGVGSRVAGMAGKRLLGAGAAAAAAGTVAAPAMALVGTGLTAYELTDLIVNGSIEAITGGSIGTGLANLFGADATSDEKKAEIDAEVKRLLDAAEERKRKRELGLPVAEQKGVAPKTPGDGAVVAPGDVTAPPSATAPSGDPVLAELVKQTGHLQMIHETIMRNHDVLRSIDTNTIRTSGINAVGALNESGMPRPSGEVKGKKGPPQPYTPLLSETTPEAVGGVYT